MKKEFDKKQRAGIDDLQFLDSQKFLDIQENIATYSDEELESLFMQKELRDDLKSAALLKQALITVSAKEKAFDKDMNPDGIDVSAEWESFRQKHITANNNQQKNIAINSDNSIHQWRKIAASLIAVIMLSGIVFAAINLQHHSDKQDPKEAILDSTKSNQELVRKNITQNIPQNTDTIEVSSRNPELFENVELETILTTMARHYDKQLIFKAETAKHLRLRFEWNKALSLQQNLAILNSFEHISITSEEDKIIVE